MAASVFLARRELLPRGGKVPFKDRRELLPTGGKVPFKIAVAEREVVMDVLHLLESILRDCHVAGK